MKAVIVLLVAATAAFAYGASNLNLLFIISEIKGLYTETVNTEEFNSVFVKDLKKNKRDNCEAEFFCQAEIELKKIPRVIGNHSVDKLLRNLKQYNNGVNCTVPTAGDEIMLRSFLDDLWKCAQMVYRCHKAAQSSAV